MHKQNKQAPEGAGIFDRINPMTALNQLRQKGYLIKPYPDEMIRDNPETGKLEYRCALCEAWGTASHTMIVKVEGKNQPVCVKCYREMGGWDYD